MNKELEKAVKKVMDDINVAHGKNTFVKLGDKPIEPMPAIPSGNAEIDEVIGCGGLPRGRIIEIYGWEGSGKSLLTMQFVANVQKLGGKCALLDLEGAFDPRWAKFLGVNVEELYATQPESGEVTFDIIERLIRSSAFDLIVVDSVAAMISKAELEQDFDEVARLGVRAQLINRGVTRISNALIKNNTIVIFINQLRKKIGVLYGNPNTTPGGLALGFFASIRLMVSKVNDSDIKGKGGAIIGHKTKIKAEKNKCGIPFKTATTVVQYAPDNGDGISKEGSPEGIVDELDITELIAFGIEKGVLKKLNNLEFTYGEAKFHRNQVKEGSDIVKVLRDMVKSVGQGG